MSYPSCHLDASYELFLISFRYIQCVIPPQHNEILLMSYSSTSNCDVSSLKKAPCKQVSVAKQAL